jgi:hypothetical protein
LQKLACHITNFPFSETDSKDCKYLKYYIRSILAHSLNIVSCNQKSKILFRMIWILSQLITLNLLCLHVFIISNFFISKIYSFTISFDILVSPDWGPKGEIFHGQVHPKDQGQGGHFEDTNGGYGYKPSGWLKENFVK